MRTSKTVIASVLSAVLILGLTACDDSGTPAITSGVTSATTATTTTNTLDDDINNPVDINEFVDTEKTLENPNLTYFSHYDARVAGDIKPGVKLFEETYGGKIDYISVAWGDRINKLQTLIASGDSPDLMDKEDLSFPSLFAKNVYEDLTDYIDISQPQWEGMDKYIEAYSWSGKHFYYPFTINALPTCLIYNKTLFENLSITDPKDLYDSGEWTWDTFRKAMQDFVSLNPNAVGGVYGIVSNSIVRTTGTPLISSDGGKIVNNMNTPEVERAANFLEGLRRENLAVRGEGMWSNETAPLVQGIQGFLAVGQWKITDYCKWSKKTGDTYGFVPFPRDPAADKYYYGTSDFGYLVPKGSQNVAGAAAFIDIMRQCQVDPDLQAVVKESIMKEKQYSEEQYEFLTSFEDPTKFDMVVDVYGGFSQETTDLIDTFMTNIAFDQSEEQMTWSQITASYTPMIDSVLDEYIALQQ